MWQLPLFNAMQTIAHSIATVTALLKEQPVHHGRRKGGLKAVQNDRALAGPWAKYTGNQTCTDGNFCRPNVTAGDPKRRSLHPTVTGIWTSTSTGDGAGRDGSSCVVVINSTLPHEARAQDPIPGECSLSTTAVRYPLSNH